MLTRRTLLAVPLAAVPATLHAATPPGVLVMAKQMDDLVSLDPHESFEASAGEVLNNLYQKLLVADLEDPGRLQGELAENWSVSGDGLTHSFLIREGALFTTGRPVTAADAAFSFQRAIRMNKAPAFILGQFGFTPANVEERIQADGRTLTLRTAERQAPSFVQYCLTANMAGIMDREAVLSHAVDGDMGNAWLRQNSAGSSPWVLRGWRPNESVVLDRAAPVPGGINRVVTRHVGDSSAQLLMLQQGDADIARNLSSDQLRALDGSPGLRRVTGDRAILMYLALNQGHPALAKPQVRQAIKWAVDYAGIGRNLVPQTWKVHQSFLPDGMPGALTDLPFQQDVAKACALLADAGLPDGFDLTIDHPAISPYAEVAQALQANLAAVGIRVTVLAGDQRQVISKTRARQHQAALLYWGSDYFDPHSNAQAFCVNPDNSDAATIRTVAWRNNWRDEGISARATANARETDTGRRLEEYRRLQRDGWDRDPFVILLQQVEVAVVRMGVSSFRLAGLAGRTDYAAVTKAG